MKILKKIRVGLAVLLGLLLTLSFLDIAGIFPKQLSALAAIQWVPALLSLSIGVLLVQLLLVFLFGRVYCSILCPLGIFQDLVAWLSKRICPKKKYSYSPAKTGLRWIVFALIVLSYLFGFTLILGLTDPYSAYGRIVTNLFRPLYVWGNNLLSLLFTAFGDYTFYRVNVPLMSVLGLIVASLTFATLSLFAWLHGRTWCNTLCPVGTFLGFLSRFSLFKLTIDTTKCNSCGLCAGQCKASCLDKKAHRIDYSRCVLCLNCAATCKKQAIRYQAVWKIKAQNQEESKKNLPDASRRRFLTGLTMGIASVPSLMADSGKRSYVKRAYRKQPIMPPGAGNRASFNAHCTACHLCVDHCPSKVLRPSLMEYGLEGVLQPVMDFEYGYCNHSCHRCSDVCPTDALKPLTEELKKRTQMGRVVFVKENCIVYKNETNCGACSEHCPTQALSMVPYKDGLTIPQAHTDICIGCGGCEYICPVPAPFKAVHVEGLDEQLQMAAIVEEKTTSPELDFGF